MSSYSRSPSRLLVLACVIGAFAFAQPAAACSLASHRDNGRYVGGDLAVQIAAKADTIQIVTVKAKHLVSRTYTQGSWFLEFGEVEAPEGHPEYTDEFVFELEPVETLKLGGDPADWMYENHLRIAGYDFSVLGNPSDGAMAADSGHPNSLPAWLLDRPGNDGYVFTGAAEGSGLGGGECSSPYFLEVGQTLVALRDSIGRLYPARGAFPLEIEAQFSVGAGRPQRLSLNMQSLIPVNGPDDPFLSRLRQAVADRP